MIRFTPKILSETIENGIQQDALHALSNFVDSHSGEDIIRYLHAQDVEIVSRTNGALLKCLRTDELDNKNPELCWKFYSGKHEIDVNDLDLEQATPEQINRSPGFTYKDYSIAIKYILDRTENGHLENIEPGTLIVVQITTDDKPSVRSYNKSTHGQMVVVGVRYDANELQAKHLISTGNPGEIQDQAIRFSNKWESHEQLQKVSRLLGTDAAPLFFRGKLSSVSKIIQGMDKSANSDPIFKRILTDFLNRVGDEPTEQDYERFFRRILRSFDDLEIHRLDQDGKIEDRTIVTKDTFKEVKEKIYQRYEDVKNEIEDTISEKGKDSPEHQADYRDLNYFNFWVKDQVAKKVFDSGPDPISKAIESLSSVDHEITEDSVIQWIRRYFEESGIISELYRLHLHDENVPSGRNIGKNSLFETFLQELQKIIEPKLKDIIDDAQF